jgi:hypothetical protein
VELGLSVNGRMHVEIKGLRRISEFKDKVTGE